MLETFKHGKFKIADITPLFYIKLLNSKTLNILLNSPELRIIKVLETSSYRKYESSDLPQQ